MHGFQWRTSYVVQTISLSTSGQLRSAVIMLMGDNESYGFNLDRMGVLNLRMHTCSLLLIDATFLIGLQINYCS